MSQTSCVPENDVMRLLLYRHAWDMAAEICLAQLPMLLHDPNAEFKVISNPSLPSAMWSQFCVFRALMFLSRCDIWYYTVLSLVLAFTAVLQGEINLHD
jgi:hypothetical protein